MLTPTGTYEDVRRAVGDALDSRGQHQRQDDGSWRTWVQLVIAVGTIVVTVTLAYGALDKRISLIEQKLNYLVSQSGTTR